MQHIIEAALNLPSQPRPDSPRLREIVVQIRSNQHKMEGVFRQLYQACTQEMITNNLALYKESLESAGEMMREIDRLVKEHEGIYQELEKTLQASAKEGAH